MSKRGPARRPCGSCPYRRDVPSGVWAIEEYEKLPRFDNPTGEQPFGAFFCHQQNGRLCAGWVGCHDMNESLGLRMACSYGLIDEADVDAAFGYECPVPLFASGAEAAAHGMAQIEHPPKGAIRTIDKIERRRERRAPRKETPPLIQNDPLTQRELLAREHAAWLDIGQEFADRRIDINEGGWSTLIYAIRKWGEELHQLRLGDPTHDDKALREAREGYEGQFERGEYPSEITR